MYKFYLFVNSKIGHKYPEFKLTQDEKHFMEIERKESKGNQVFQESIGVESVGKSLPHASGDKQLTGEAIYVDDLPKVHNEAYAVIVPSTIPHGYIKLEF